MASFHNRQHRGPQQSERETSSATEKKKKGKNDNGEKEAEKEDTEEASGPRRRSLSALVVTCLFLFREQQLRAVKR